MPCLDSRSQRFVSPQVPVRSPCFPPAFSRVCYLTGTWGPSCAVVTPHCPAPAQLWPGTTGCPSLPLPPPPPEPGAGVAQGVSPKPQMPVGLWIPGQARLEDWVILEQRWGTASGFPALLCGSSAGLWSWGLSPGPRPQPQP